MSARSNRVKSPSSWTSYEVQTAGDAYVVIECRSGRPMSDLLSWLDAGKLRDKLNAASFGGRSSLYSALGVD